MRLIIYTKNLSLAADIYTEDGPTPRVGEVLALPHLADMCGGMHLFLVTDVSWLLNGQKLQAEVTAQAANPEAHRLVTLQEQQWLPPSPPPARERG